ncbi:7-cyano-7-deazaguanine synthase [Oceanobacillus indicireducens]|uniref:7-cyano-7-deazaguanine synthase n=1 Tax=Oceanobacillus indicireducens TaxID=1004261 RepID=A0A917XWN3_9BACI|nr:7-cyano-7-deazaguanine synthase [Oceanobacillus indicireducens]GGN54808.1 hypothetical protein GCM10007971_12960 [Oceanobacillus indicireducens]
MKNTPNYRIIKVIYGKVVFKIKKVLWTGGWDSTFRVLDLVLNKKETVLPYYVFDSGRKSTDMEIETMENIRGLIADISKEAAGRIMKSEMINKSGIPQNEEITTAFKTLANQSHLGGQYDWLARYCEHNSVSNLELCVHLDDTVEGFIKKDVRLVEKGNDHYYELIDDPSQQELNIFSYYNYPLLNMTKLDMEAQAKDKGFSHIMEETWFCHSPYKGKPCGMCNPCKYTRDEGLGRRVPTPSFTMRLNRKLNGKLNGLKKRLGVK